MSKSKVQVGVSRRRMLQATMASTVAAAVPSSTQARSSAQNAGVLDVVVIGAGLAGLTAARDLQRAGCDSFAVLEANGRVGGRTLNHKLKGGHYSEAGGQWVGPGQTAIYDLCRELNIGMHPTYLKGKSVYRANDGSMYEEDAGGGFSVSPELHKVIQELNALSATVPSAAPWTSPRAAEFDSISIWDWLAPRGLNALDTLSIELGFRLTDTMHPQKVSLLYALSRINSAGSWEQLEGFAGGAQEQRIENGSQYISEVLGEQLGDKLHLSSAVRRIADWNSDVVSVHTDSGIFKARQVILAISPALCHQIDFAPELPKNRAELQKRWPNYAPGRKTAHVYHSPFWRAQGYNAWFFTIGGGVMWAYDNSPEDESIGVINAFIHPSLPKDPKVLEAKLSGYYADAFGAEALSPIEFHDKDWGEEVWCPSCVSPLPPGFLTSGLMDALREPIGKLVWSGTESAEIWQTYMDGAVRSGHRAALQALHSLQQSVV